MIDRPAASPPFSSPRLAVAGALAAVAVIFGGGGSSAPAQELVVELAALLALGIWLLLPVDAPRPAQDRPMWLAAALLAAVPLLQLVPLPPAVWHRLPGRTAEIAALGLVGAELRWQPLSIAPYRTLASALSLLPPFAMMLFVSRLGVRQRHALLGIVAALGGAAALLGMLQLAGGPDALRLYPGSTAGFAVGFQANRNQSADILLIAMLALLACAAAVPRANTLLGRMTVAAGLLFLALAVMLTGSRTGTALLLVVLVSAVPLLLPARRRGRMLAGIGLAVAVVGALGFALAGNAALERTWTRFGETGDARFETIWPDAVYALRQHWPAGSGVGTFVQAFEPGERLEVVDATNPVRAHNDYLEYAIEAGLPGSLVLLVLAIAIGRALRIAWRRRDADASVSPGWWFCVSSILVLALHSVVDYPLRSMSLAVLGGMIAGMIAGRGDTAIKR